MDQNSLVIEQADRGRSLLKALEQTAFDVHAAFWAKPVDDGHWFFYLVSPFVDEKGVREAYGVILNVLRRNPDLWFDSSEIRVLRTNDSMAEAVRSILSPKHARGPFAAPNPRSYPGMTWFNGSSLGGVEVEGAYIYPPIHSEVGDGIE